MKLLATLTAALVALLASTATPAHAEPETDSVSGSVTNLIGTLTVDAHNLGSGTSATGTFTADGIIVPGLQPTKFRFFGPVTCLDVRGNRAGLIYPLDEASGTIGQFAKGLAIWITIVDGGPGKPDQVGFIGPAPINTLTFCPPNLALLPSTSGDLVVTDVD